MKLINITGQVFGRLTVVNRVEDVKVGRPRWLCKCSCGNEKIISSDVLQRANKPTQSCGCLRKEITGNRARSHGMTGTHLHRIWKSMRRRCFDKNQDNYKYYGGRGISICNEWESFETFQTWANTNGYAAHLTIDRIDNSSDYTPNNCRWTTMKTQCLNRRQREYAPWKNLQERST